MKKSVFLVVPMLFLLASCVTLPRPFEKPEAQVVIPANYLYSGSESLDEWLDKPFTLRYMEMPFEDIFNSYPLYGLISYRIDKMPEDPEPFTLQSPGMTRRQLLWALALRYHLHYHYEYVDGMPSVMVIVADPKPETTSFDVD